MAAAGCRGRAGLEVRARRPAGRRLPVAALPRLPVRRDPRSTPDRRDVLLVREAARRTVRMRHWRAGAGGIALFGGALSPEDRLAKEGSLPPCRSCCGHCLERALAPATANDYLARRDAEWMGPVYRLLGLSAGMVLSGDVAGRTAEAAYAARHRLRHPCELVRFPAETGWQRNSGNPLAWLPTAGKSAADKDAGGEFPFSSGGTRRDPAPCSSSPHFMLVDEADSLLIGKPARR